LYVHSAHSNPDKKHFKTRGVQKEHQFDFMTGVLVHGELWYAQTQLMFGLQVHSPREDYIPTLILFRADLAAKGMSVF
jgi:hypothetical protein